jgi:hypothetical protein
MSLTMTTESPKRGRKPQGDKPKDRSKDRHIRPRKAFHADPELFAAMEAYRRSLRPRPDDSEILRTALELFLTERGFSPWPVPEAPESPG